MASRLTREVRQEIVREFAVRHNGQFDAALFFKEVQEKGRSHPAYAWFQWDIAKAAHERHIEQARDFARDLRVTFRVEEVTGPHQVRVRETAMPLVQSPLDGRSKGGGYRLVDPDDPDHIEEHCRQAARTLEQWLNRYQAALAHAKIKPTDIEKIVGRLEAKASPKARPQMETSPQATA